MKKTISVLLLTTFILTSCGKKEVVIEDTPQTVKYVKTEIVSKKTFWENLKLNWKISSSNETNISSQVSWLVKTINYKVWDKVKSGDIIAVIDTQTNLANINLNNANSIYNNTLNVYNLTKESVQKDLNTAKLQYENALTTKENTYSTTQKQLELAQVQLDNILKQKDNTSDSSKTAINIANESLESSKLALTNFDKNYEETLKSLETKRKIIQDKKQWLIDTLKATIDTWLAWIDSWLSNVDLILWITNLNKSANDSYEIYLSAKNTNFKFEAESIFSKANWDFENFKKTYNKDLSSEEIIKLYDNLLNLSYSVVSLYDKMTQVLDNTVSSQSLTESTLNTFKINNKTYQTSVLWLRTSLVSINNTLTDLDNSIIDVENTISSTKTTLNTQRLSLEQAIKIAEANLNNTKAWTKTSFDSISWSTLSTKIQLENTIANIKSSREIADNALKIAENQLSSTKARYDAQLAGTKSQLDSANWQKDSANQQIANSQIKAPFDWIITSKNVDVWTLVNPWSVMFSISNNENKIVKLDVNSDNIDFIKKDLSVLIQKNSKSYSGNISLVSLSADNTTKLFKVEVKINKEHQNELNLWDFVDVFIKKENSLEKFIIVPFSAILAWTVWEHSVFVVWSWNIIEEKKVKTWTSNSNEVIINSWLEEWQKVVISWTLDVQVWDKVEER